MDIQTFLVSITKFLNSTIIPFLMAVAFLVFIWNITRYFIFKGANEKEHENARSLAIYGITAFVIIVGFWGIVNFFVGGFGFGGQGIITPDYMQKKGGSIGTGGAGGNQASDPYACTGGGGTCLDLLDKGSTQLTN